MEKERIQQPQKPQQQQPLTKQVVSYLGDRAKFLELLKLNKGLIIIKFGASWCKPCQIIKPIVEGFFASSPHEVLCCDIDVDTHFDLYSFLKSKRMVNGIPVIFCYKRGNLGYAPDDSVTGADPKDLDSFFKRCGGHLVNVKNQFSKIPVIH
jgi:thiol-disulfide isomerase/thioredoxin